MWALGFALSGILLFITSAAYGVFLWVGVAFAPVQDIPGYLFVTKVALAWAFIPILGALPLTALLIHYYRRYKDTH